VKHIEVPALKRRESAGTAQAEARKFARRTGMCFLGSDGFLTILVFFSSRPRLVPSAMPEWPRSVRKDLNSNQINFFIRLSAFHLSLIRDWTHATHRVRGTHRRASLAISKKPSPVLKAREAMNERQSIFFFQASWFKLLYVDNENWVAGQTISPS
jgi:hypothetical protein